MTPLSSIQIANKPLAQQILFTEKEYTVEICRDQTSLNTAFRLRYRAYLGVKAISENEEELLYDEYDWHPNAFIHLVWYQGKPVATVRSCIYAERYGWEATEGINYFPEDVTNKLGSHTHCLESNRYAVDPDFQGRQSLFAQLLLFRAHALNAFSHGCTQIITAVRANHIPFYQRFLGMEQISTSERFIPWADAQVVLLATPTEKCLAMAVKRGMPDIDQLAIQHYAACAGISTATLSTNLAA